MEELDEQKEKSQCLLEQLKFQGTVATVDRELKTRDIATKEGDFLNLYQQLMVPNDAPMDSITKRLRKPILLCHTDKGGTQEVFVWLQRDHRILTDSDARNVFELEGCEAADNLLSLKNNLD